jgi:Domain of unknown function (DUF4105)
MRRAGLAAWALLALGACALGPARADRDWYPYLARVSQVERSETAFTIAPISDWSYNRDGPTAQTYASAAFALDDLRQVWFVLEPQPGSALAAHTLLLFEFTDDRLLGLTIEARREAGEEYSAVRGAFNAFELSYLWGSARDFLTRRAVLLGHEVFVYPVAIADERKRRLLTWLLQRTDELEARPRYYNTLFSNCTNELAKAAGFSWAPAFILTGRSDEYLFRRGIIPGADFATAHARSDLSDFIAGLNEAPPEAFDAALLAELRRRNGA